MHNENKDKIQKASYHMDVQMVVLKPRFMVDPSLHLDFLILLFIGCPTYHSIVQIWVDPDNPMEQPR